MAAGERDGTIRVYNLGSDQEVPRVDFEKNQDSLNSLAFAADGKELLLADDRRVLLWNVQDDFDEILNLLRVSGGRGSRAPVLPAAPEWRPGPLVRTDLRGTPKDRDGLRAELSERR